MKRNLKLVLVICLMALAAVAAVGCGGGKEAKEMPPEQIYMSYNALESRFSEVLDFYEALDNKKVSKFDFRFIADSAKSSSKRLIETLKTSKDPLAPKLTEIAKDVIAFTEQVERNVDHGEEIDWSDKEKIQSKLDALRPEMEELKEEIMQE